jgi:hypothetical protein
MEKKKNGDIGQNITVLQFNAWREYQAFICCLSLAQHLHAPF